MSYAIRIIVCVIRIIVCVILGVVIRMVYDRWNRRKKQ